MEYKDYYKVMGVERDASQDQIKRSYRKLARKFHPDVSKIKDAEVRFKEVGEAYEVLKDPEKRAAYDQLGANWQSGQDFRPPPDWDNGFEYSGAGSKVDPAEFSDFFESIFGSEHHSSNQGGNHRSFHARGNDHHAKVLIDIKDCYQGARQTITMRAPEVDKSGDVNVKERSLNVQIPKGVKQGQRIRLAGQGAPGIGEGKAGDLYLEIGFKQHPFFRAEERDIYVELPLAPWEAALGARVKVPTPDGTVELSIPPNTGNGSKLRMKGRGIPGKPAGDIYVIPVITLPPANSEIAKEFYQKMEQELAFNPREKLGV
jgi:curved DNA-binding protein